MIKLTTKYNVFASMLKTIRSILSIVLESEKYCLVILVGFGLSILISFFNLIRSLLTTLNAIYGKRNKTENDAIINGIHWY